MCTELDAKEAADVLNVSLATLNQILDREDIPYRQVGSQRLISYTDMIKYRSNSVRKRYAALSELVEYDREVGI
jgi:excisionase family DNA binding protein